MTELALTDREARRLRQLEQNIAQAGGTMYESLKAIHDEKLYREHFPTWEAYCSARWRMSRFWAYRVIEHGRILALLNEESQTGQHTGQDLLTIGNISESATRALAGLTDEQKVEIIKHVASQSAPAKGGGKKVTAKAVRAKVAEVAPKKKRKKSTEVSSAKLVDKLSKKHVGPLVRGIDEVANVLGGKGPFHAKANDALNDLIAALKGMRGGQQ